jgi:hypothetical protein
MRYDEILTGSASDTLLNRKDAADLLTRMGFKTSPATLATKASRGGGPTYQCWGKKPLYSVEDLMAWAKARLKKPQQSTSERDDGHATKLHGKASNTRNTYNAPDRL